ncbi:hypothetical protein [Aminobacter sp. MSH1]|nr:hypothetical protein [Aminobacter sp. MSH1]
MIDAETAPIIYIQAQADQAAHVLADLEAGTPPAAIVVGAEAE